MIVAVLFPLMDTEMPLAASNRLMTDLKLDELICSAMMNTNVI
jgi:hypothetical protein